MEGLQRGVKFQVMEILFILIVVSFTDVCQNLPNCIL